MRYSDRHEVAWELQPVGKSAQVDFLHDENIMRTGNMSYIAKGKCCAFPFRTGLFVDQQILHAAWSGEHCCPKKGRSGRAACVSARSQSAIGDRTGNWPLATGNTIQADDDDMGRS